jgi:hypothetical protein
MPDTPSRTAVIRNYPSNCFDTEAHFYEAQVICLLEIAKAKVSVRGIGCPQPDKPRPIFSNHKEKRSMPSFNRSMA